MNNKKNKIISITVISVIVLSLVCGLIFLIYNRIINSPNATPPHYYTFRQNTYSSSYTEEQHIKRIEDIIDENLIYGDFAFYNEENNKKYKVEKKNITNIEILYSFYYEFPEFFLVEGEYLDETNTLQYAHVIGFINDDKYYTVGTHNTNNVFNVSGKSPYKMANLTTQKKYYSPDNLYGYYSDGVKIINENGTLDEHSTRHCSEVSKKLGYSVTLVAFGNAGCFNNDDYNEWLMNNKRLFPIPVGFEPSTLPNRQFNSNYTKQQNLERLTNLVTQNLESLNFSNVYEVDDIKTIEIINSFYYEYPEFFIIEFSKQTGSDITQGEYILGQIRNDEFYIIYKSDSYDIYNVSPYRKYQFYNEETKYFAVSNNNYYYGAKKDGAIWCGIENSVGLYEKLAIGNFCLGLQELDAKQLEILI